VHSVAYKEHVFFGVGHSDKMARQAVDDWFALQHTSYYQLLNDIGAVQGLLRKYKVQAFENRGMMFPNHELAQISRVVWSVFDEEDQSFDLNRLYRLWSRDIESKVYDEYEYRLDVERIRLGMSNTSLWPWLREKVFQRALELWAQDRFLNGYWITPSDEIEQMLNPAQDIHTPLHEIAQNASRPSDYGRQSNAERWRTGSGRFRFNFNPPELRGRPIEHYLPPDRLLQMMDMRFNEVVSLRMDAALAEIVRPHTTLPYNEFDRIEAHLAAFKGPQIITLLEEPYAWFEVDDTSGRWPLTLFPIPPGSDVTVASSIPDDEEPEEQSFAKLEDAAPDVPDERDGRFDGQGEDGDLGKPCEPRIEVVATNDDPPCYGIVDGWSTTSDERDESDAEHEDHSSERSNMESVADSSLPSPKVGKRKAMDDEDGPNEERGPRSRLGSGQTSHSGDSTNTALVTPDESPSLLAEERIQVADEDDAATDTTPVAALAINNSPVASPTLGKRKSPDDDDLIRPPRRPASISTPTRATSDASDDDMGEGEVKDDAQALPGDTAGIKTERGTDPDNMEEDEAKQSSVDDEIMRQGQAADATIDDDMAADSEAKRSDSDKLSSPPSTSEDGDILQLPRKSISDMREEFSEAIRVEAAAIAERWRREDSEYSDLYDSQSDVSIDSEKLAEVPSVPPSWSRLGPGFDELLASTWFLAREKLRLCRCGVCLRARREAAEAERRKYLEEENDTVVPGVLRIA
jgi:hypothetical protein